MMMDIVMGIMMGINPVRPMDMKMDLILDMNVEEIRDTLRLTGDDK